MALFILAVEIRPVACGRADGRLPAYGRQAAGSKRAGNKRTGNKRAGSKGVLVAEQLRLMAVHAHPDDESSKGAATMARYVAEGVEVLVATCTGGERGSVLNPKMDRPEGGAGITNIPRGGMDRARGSPGVRQAWLGFLGSGGPAGAPP